MKIIQLHQLFEPNDEIDLDVKDAIVEKNDGQTNPEDGKSEATTTVVYSVAVLENSPSSCIMQEIKSLEKFIFSENHLENNIESIEINPISKWAKSVRINLKRVRLWKGTRQYFWKHLGRNNFWDRSNGTRIRLTKINVK